MLVIQITIVGMRPCVGREIFEFKKAPRNFRAFGAWQLGRRRFDALLRESASDFIAINLHPEKLGLCVPCALLNNSMPRESPSDGTGFNIPVDGYAGAWTRVGEGRNLGRSGHLRRNGGWDMGGRYILFLGGEGAIGHVLGRCRRRASVSA